MELTARASTVTTPTGVDVVATQWPTVSIVIPALNEAGYIARCLDNVLEFDYPRELIEIFVVDGGSVDRSRDIVAEYARRDERVQMLSNPDRTSAAALNVGIRTSSCDVIVRLDAHASYSPDYVMQSVKALQSAPGIGSAAGPQIAAGESFWQSVVALAMRQPFAAGDAQYRFSKHSSSADTVFLGAWRRDVAVAVGGFDEAWRINADYEFNIRLRKAGYQLYLSPEIKSTYYPRASLGGLARQYFRYGFWRVRTIYAHPKYARWRQFVPPAFAVALTVSLGLAPTTLMPLEALGGAYGVVAVAATTKACSRTRWILAPALPLAFAVMHTAWGIGFLCGVVRWAPSFARRQADSKLLIADRPSRATE
ncbi:MAG: glycosyltransferase family 2 protein [Fimbriimonadaceae bacterium]